MKKLARYIILAVVAGVMAQTLQAGLITRGVGFEGSVTIDTSSVGTATEITGWINPIVAPSPPSGTFALAPYALTPGMPATFTSQIWAFGSNTPITNFWNVGGFKFELLSWRIVAQDPGSFGVGQSGYAIIQGTGIVSGNGYTPTAFTWAFTSQDPKSGANPDSWSFSAGAYTQNSNGAPVLASSRITNAAVLSWSDSTFALQAATNVAGIYSDVPGATSPYTNSTTGAPRFFRLKQP
jgi:hypothetical protein